MVVNALRLLSIYLQLEKLWVVSISALAVADHTLHKYGYINDDDDGHYYKFRQYYLSIYTSRT